MFKFVKSAAVAAIVAGAFASSLASAATTYIVGTGATYRPFEFETPNKELVGFDVDLMKAIAKEAGFEVKFINPVGRHLQHREERRPRHHHVGHHDHRSAQG